MNPIATAARMWLTRSFRPFCFSNSFDSFLSYSDTEKLGLYVHIPFCRSLCEFCPYCKVVYEKSLAEKYIAALLKEIEMVGKMNGGKKKTVTSLYFGGGTPALLVNDIGRIIAKIQEYFIITEGIGLELHPLDVTVEKLEILKNAGVSKISIGIQSFQPVFLESLGRGHIDYSKMFSALEEVKFETVSMDFIFALPGQRISHIKNDIETAYGHGANHVAIYPFIDFTYTSRKFPKMSRTEEKKLLYEIVAYCKEKGYVRDSIWTFSKTGHSKYSSMTRENFLGFGCSATTLLKDQFKINTFGIEEYISRIDKNMLPTSLTLKYSLRQRMVYFLFWTLYSMNLDNDDFENFFGKELEKYYGLELKVARLLGYLKKEDSGYTMTTKGSYYYHYFEDYYTLSYIDQMWSLMKKTAFPEELIIK